MKPALRSAGAVLLGLVTAGVVVLALTAVAVWIFFGGDYQAEPTPAYMGVNLAYSLGAGVLGGWVAARVAGRAPLLHGAALAVAMALLSLLSTGQDTTAPSWYGTAVTVVGALGALLGAWITAARPGREPAGSPGA